MTREDALPPEVLLEDYPPAMAALAQGLRDIVRSAVPEAEERVRTGWRVIGYDLRLGRRSSFFAWIMPQREHVHLGFPWGIMLLDRGGVLEGEGVTKRARWLTVVNPVDLRDPNLAAYARAAADLATLGRRG
jgi:Domain of unknown function (DU1801)